MSNKWICSDCQHRNSFVSLRCRECPNRRWRKIGISEVRAREILARLIQLDRGSISIGRAIAIVQMYNG